MFDTPILFLIYNRPDLTKQVFAKIREIEPKILFIGADGPKDTVKNEYETCEEARSIVSNIDWDCKVKKLYQTENLGCKTAVSKAISWFFSQNEHGIILEDDILPNLTFFKFCRELLLKYKDEKRLFSITGVNWQDNRKRGDGSYYFSKYPGIWGWATWKDRWDKFDIEMKGLPEYIENGELQKVFHDEKESAFHAKNLMGVYNGIIDSWDFIWHYTNFKNGGLCVVPNENLTSNLGFDRRATHTKDIHSDRANRAVSDIDFPLIHPKQIIQDEEADRYLYKKYIAGKMTILNSIIHKISNGIKNRR